MVTVHSSRVVWTKSTSRRRFEDTTLGGSILSALEEGGADQISDENEVQGRDARRDPTSARSWRAVQTGS
jgi:hypothetical protein